MAAIGPSTYWTNTRFVSTTGSDLTGTVNGYPYQTVLAAVNAATAGEIV